jgi:hypothetical protein
MKTFYLNRKEDVGGVSGIGKIAEGVVFSNGWCAMTWLTSHTSVAFYPSLDTLIKIHGHDGKTELVMVDS